MKSKEFTPFQTLQSINSLANLKIFVNLKAHKFNKISLQIEKIHMDIQRNSQMVDSKEMKFFLPAGSRIYRNYRFLSLLPQRFK